MKATRSYREVIVPLAMHSVSIALDKVKQTIKTLLKTMAVEDRNQIPLYRTKKTGEILKAGWGQSQASCVSGWALPKEKINSLLVGFFFFFSLSYLKNNYKNTIMFNSIINLISRISGTTMTCVGEILQVWRTLPVLKIHFVKLTQICKVEHLLSDLHLCELFSLPSVNRLTFDHSMKKKKPLRPVDIPLITC